MKRVKVFIWSATRLAPSRFISEPFAALLERVDLLVVRFRVCARLVTGKRKTVAIRNAMIRCTLILLSLRLGGRICLPETRLL